MDEGDDEEDDNAPGINHDWEFCTDAVENCEVGIFCSMSNNNKTDNAKVLPIGTSKFELQLSSLLQ